MKKILLQTLMVGFAFAPTFAFAEEAKLISYEAAYKYDYADVMSGGVKRDSSGLGNLDLKLNFNLEAANLCKGCELFLYGLGTHGDDPSAENIGNTQVVSNIEANNTFKLYETWFQKKYASDALSLKLGLYDLNSEFYSTGASSLFLNSSFGIGKELAQTGSNGPSIFSVTSLGLRLRAELADGYYLQGVVLDGAPGHPKDKQGTQIKVDSNEGVLMVTEFGKESETDGKYQKVGLGFWTYSEPFDDLTEEVSPGIPSKHGNNGAYLIFDKTVCENVRGFLRAGIASPKVNEVRANYSTGFNWSSPFASRKDDSFGFALTYAELSPSHKNATMVSDGIALKDAELTYELTYKAMITENVSIQPDFQYVDRPSGNPNIDPALVGMVRVQLSYAGN